MERRGGCRCTGSNLYYVVLRIGRIAVLRRLFPFCRICLDMGRSDFGGEHSCRQQVGEGVEYVRSISQQSACGGCKGQSHVCLRCLATLGEVCSAQGEWG